MIRSLSVGASRFRVPNPSLTNGPLIARSAIKPTLSLLRAFFLLLFQAFQPLVAIATTPQGIKTLQPLCQTHAVRLWIPESLSTQIAAEGRVTYQTYTGSLRQQLATLWPESNGFVFCLATGAVVRLIAPLLQGKTVDPAIVVVDEAAQFAISLCSGHQGGADRLAQSIACQLGATPVLTGAANNAGLPGIDVLGLPFGWQRGNGDWTGVSAAIARQATVQVIQSAGSTLWQAQLPAGHSFHFNADACDRTSSTENPQARIWIGPHHQMLNAATAIPEVYWHPRLLWIGIGCERGTPKPVIETAIQQICQRHQLSEDAIAGIATIDLKTDEVGLVALCRDRNWPLQAFTADALSAVPVPTPSTIVAKEVGTPSVAEAAAILAAQQSSPDLTPDGANTQAVSTQNNQQFPLNDERLTAPKQIFRLAGYPGAVTVAVAQAAKEYTGRTGSLFLVGIGPGQLDQMTPAARTAIVQADAVVGYQRYMDSISSLMRPGQIAVALPITQERQRAERAIALAQWGLTVAVVSSGDCGIYGMAGLVLEELQAQDWDGKTPAVQVFPGISALQAAAARVGAPLMHDFCAISLSDLLTPWSVIETRLVAAAAADFVTALYNPRSQTRTHQIVRAQAIFLQHRPPNTPVATIRAAYRPDEQITLTTLEQLLEAPIDMVTTILIGNKSTRFHANWIITPRGYSGFEQGHAV